MNYPIANTDECTINTHTCGNPSMTTHRTNTEGSFYCEFECEAQLYRYNTGPHCPSCMWIIPEMIKLLTSRRLCQFPTLKSMPTSHFSLRPKTVYKLEAVEFNKARTATMLELTLTVGGMQRTVEASTVLSASKSMAVLMVMS